MANVEIYTTTVCLYCIRAKSLLKSKNVEYVEHNMTGKDDEREKLLKMTGGQRTVPQIFIDGKHIGGCDRLYELNDSGELDKLLAA